LPSAAKASRVAAGRPSQVGRQTRKAIGGLLESHDREHSAARNVVVTGGRHAQRRAGAVRYFDGRYRRRLSYRIIVNGGNLRSTVGMSDGHVSIPCKQTKAIKTGFSPGANIISPHRIPDISAHGGTNKAGARRGTRTQRGRGSRIVFRRKSKNASKKSLS